jgi:hypothetical protein
MSTAKIAVSADALSEVLTALLGSGHLVRELQATRSLAASGLGGPNAINTLVDEYRAWMAGKDDGGVQSSAILPAFMGVAKRKLDDLTAQGWRIDGFAISKQPDVPAFMPRYGFITVGGMVGWWRSPEEERQAEAATVERALRNTIQLTPAEIQSRHDRVRWAEGLIKQLPENHDGRNSWLLNYGRDAAERQADWARRNGKTPHPVIQHVPVDDTEGGAI